MQSRSGHLICLSETADKYGAKQAQGSTESYQSVLQEHALSSYETTRWQSYRETVSSLHEVTAPLRKASLFS